MADAREQCQRPWWKRPPVWLIAAAVVLALLIGVVKQAVECHSLVSSGIRSNTLAGATVLPE